MPSIKLKFAWRDKNIERFRKELELDEEELFIHQDDYICELLDISEWKEGLVEWLQCDTVSNLGILIGSLKRRDYIDSYNELKMLYPNVEED